MSIFEEYGVFKFRWEYPVFCMRLQMFLFHVVVLVKKKKVFFSSKPHLQVGSAVMFGM